MDAIIGENGAFYSTSARWPAADALSCRCPDPHTRDLERIRELGRAHPARGAAWQHLASDQAWHAADLAIDHAEDVAPLPADAVAEIVRIMQGGRGMTATVSSIHVNGWFGEHDKLSMSRLCAAELLGEDVDARRRRMAVHRRLGQRCEHVRAFSTVRSAWPMCAKSCRNCRASSSHASAEAAAAAGFAEMAAQLLAARRW
ncbi:HAD family hydrolase [Cupriavidus basilensis]